jgi:hypothetical protein
LTTTVSVVIGLGATASVGISATFQSMNELAAALKAMGELPSKLTELFNESVCLCDMAYNDQKYVDARAGGGSGMTDKRCSM